MRRLETFYERDVLERVRQLLSSRTTLGAAIDAGAFIGTHSIFFALFCPVRPVISFEPNADTFPTLVLNIRSNGLEGNVVPVNRALGSREGRAVVVPGPVDNQGGSRVRYLAEGSTGRVPVSTLDDEVNQRKLGPVALIKIDVEGAELEVLRGGRSTILADRPLICIEVHTVSRLISTLRILRRGKYCVLDCLGYSPTYIVAPRSDSYLRRHGANSAWVIRALVPSSLSRTKWYLKRLAQVLAGSSH
jgi:FkbM family methyltransferase